MAKTLVIKGANFSTNKLATVTIDDPVYCTGISLNKSSTSITGVGTTETLTATLTPADTTEAVTWSTSDSNVATVSNGTVTVVGVGTATITATCGSYSAACTVTARAFITGTNLYPDTYLSGDTSYSGGNGVLECTTTGTTRGMIVADSGTYSIKNKYHDVFYYPVPIPANAARLKITRADTTIRISSLFFCSQTTPATGTSYTQLVDKVDNENISYTDNVAYVTIPQHEGYPAVDSVAVLFIMTNISQTFQEAYFDKITIEALPAAA